MSYGTEFCLDSRGHQNLTAKVQMLGVETRDAHSKIVQVEVIKSWKRLPGRRNGVVKLELDFGQNEQIGSVSGTRGTLENDSGKEMADT